MGLRANPTYRQRRYGAEIRGIRESAGFTAASAAEVMGMNASHITTVESGRTGLSEERLRRLAGAAAVGSGEGATYLDALVELGQESGKGWWTEYRRSLRPSLLDLAELEAGSQRIVCYEPMFVPGLLQTLDYATVIHRDGYVDASTAEHDRAVEFRMRRRGALTRERPPRLHAVVHEAALHTSFGRPDVMRDQLRHLIEMSRLPNVTVQVVPFDGPVPYGTSFTLIEPHQPRLGTVIVAHVVQSLYLGDANSLDTYNNRFDRLSEQALPPVDAEVTPEGHARKDSLGLIQRLLYPLL
ncbi:helix-turn-helix transcriptional regulator [Streptomyces sp. NPDC086554]|uniref:helix-turn-helix domain-containing protein n=1 Tax=Streptomyces sp. NPDC086554 TaxID=3154864 RepID=UPI0034372B96